MKTIRCPVCQGAVDVRTATGRTSKKPFLMLVCPADGRHFRAFISDPGFVADVTSMAARSIRSVPGGQGSAQ